ncbi:unnamed protein product [Absidia cylindrospora]
MKKQQNFQATNNDNNVGAEGNKAEDDEGAYNEVTTTRKINLHSFLKSTPDARHLNKSIQRAVKIAFDIQIKAHLYVSFYLSHWLKKNQQGHPTASLFQPNFWCAMYSLVRGDDTPLLNEQEKEEHGQLFNEYLERVSLDDDGGYQVAENETGLDLVLNEFGEQAAHSMSNNIVNNFRARCITYFKLRLYELLPDFPPQDAFPYAVQVYEILSGNQEQANLDDLEGDARNGMKNAMTELHDQVPDYLLPLTRTNISQQTNQYIRFLDNTVKYIEKHNNNPIQFKRQVQTVATFDWVKGVVNNYEPLSGFSGRSRARLCKKLLYLINKNHAAEFKFSTVDHWLDQDGFDYFKGVVTDTRWRIQNSVIYHQFPDHGQRQRNDCFRQPIDEARAFSLVPRPSQKMKYICIDYNTLVCLSNKAPMTTKQCPAVSPDQTMPTPDTPVEHAKLFHSFFDFTRIQNAPSEAIFSNVIYTNGVGVRVLYKTWHGRKDHRHLDNIRLQPTDFTLDDLDYFRFWGVDPGMKQVVVAVDGSDDDKPHEIRKFSARAYYHGAKHEQRSHGLRRSHIQQMTSHSDASTQTKQELTSEEMDEQLVNIFIGDGTGNNSSSSKTSSKDRVVSHDFNPTKWRKLPPYSQHKIPVVCLGDANFTDSQTDRSLVKRCKDLLVKAERDGRLIYMEIDEYLTSQRCSRCCNLTLTRVQIANGDFLYGVLRCQSCGRLWQRDVNAARNIHSIVMHQIRNNTLTRPHHLERPHGQDIPF